MVPLYVISVLAFSGKSALCVGLGNKLRSDGYTIGYMKPVSSSGKAFDEQIVDEDANFMKQVFGLLEPLKVLAPLVLTPQVVEEILNGRAQDYVSLVKAAYEQVIANKDIVLVEGAAGITEGAIARLSVYDVARLLNLKVLLVVRYTDDLSMEAPLLIKSTMGDALVGMVFNAVPRAKMELIESEAKPYLESQGIKCFGVLTQERILLSVSVAELAEILEGQILNSPEQGEDLVENLMVGAMGVDSALEYFRRKPNKAVITGGDRPDIQLAALQTSTRCIICTGGIQPNQLILAQAEDLGVPMILAKQDTLTALEIIERIFGKTRFHQKKKVAEFEKLLEERFDFASLYARLGL
ncbi:MAG: phosphotransacetylase family protein [Chloroflexi bacterium]|nr:phosphotransacetylase family protein [Chloroflexota bacterium]